MNSSEHHTSASDHEFEPLIQSITLLRAGLKISADSCSLIFLNRLRMLEDYASIHTLVITQEIFNEIMYIPRKKVITDDRKLYKKLLGAHVMMVPTPERSSTDPQTAMSIADRSLIQAYETLDPDGILTDDKSLCRYCHEHTIPYINTPMAVFILLYNEKISRDQYTATLNSLYKMGRYGQFVRDFMQKLYSRYCTYKNHV